MSVGVGSTIGADGGAKFDFVARLDDQAVESISVFGIASSGGALVFVEFCEFVVDPNFRPFNVKSVGTGCVGKGDPVVARLFDLSREVKSDG